MSIEFLVVAGTARAFAALIQLALVTRRQASIRPAQLNGVPRPGEGGAERMSYCMASSHLRRFIVVASELCLSPAVFSQLANTAKKFSSSLTSG